MFCILLANLRKRVKTPYNLLCVNEDFEDKADAEITLLDSFFYSSLSVKFAAFTIQLPTALPRMPITVRRNASSPHASARVR